MVLTAARRLRAGRRLGAALALTCAAVTLADELSESLAAVRADEAQRVAKCAQAARAVVCIFASATHGGGGGSGVIINEHGYGLTNFHVVAGFLEARRGVGGLSDGRLYPLTVLGVDPGGDIALFKLAGKERFDFAPLGNSEHLQVGQWVAAMGNPFGLAEDYTPTITVGVISGLHRYQEGQGNALEYADCIQVSTSINPGNSGGPLFDLNGRVIGINGRASFEERGRVNVGLGYAVSMRQIERFLPGLRAGHLCEHGTLGATVQLAGEELLCNAVQEFSPAARAGVRPGDVVVAIAGRIVRTANDFNNVLATLPAHWPVEIRLCREGRNIVTAARLERLPVTLEAPFIPGLEHARTELRRVFGLYEQRDRGLCGAQVTALRWRGRVYLAGAEGAAPEEVVVTQDAEGLVRVARGAVPAAVEFRVGDARPVGHETAPGAEPTADESFWWEWYHVTAPLLARPDAEAEHASRVGTAHQTLGGGPQVLTGWDAVGGDEWLGEVVAVAQRRYPGGDRIRWKFGFDTGTLRAVVVGQGDLEDDTFLVATPAGPALSSALLDPHEFPDGKAPVSTLWVPEDRREFGDLRWPRIWRRFASSGEEIRLEMDSCEASTSGETQAATASEMQAATENIAAGGDGAGSTGAVRTGAAIDAACQRVVKLYGAQIGREPGYGSGVLVSADGLIVTTLALLLEGQSLRVVLPDGRRLPAEVLARDEGRQLALLKIEASGLPYFELSTSAHLRPGDGIIVAANPFKVAEGSEPPSITIGVLAARTTLAARRRAQDFPYRGDVLLTDVIISTPGCAGGAVVDAQGHLVGVIGRAVIGERTNTWLNYALPVEEIAAFVERRGNEATRQRGNKATRQQGNEATGRATLGIRLFAVGGRAQPAYVERVRRGSPADQAGVRPNDLVVSLAGQRVATCDDYFRILETLQPGQQVELVVKRGEELKVLGVRLERKSR